MKYAINGEINFSSIIEAVTCLNILAKKASNALIDRRDQISITGATVIFDLRFAAEKDMLDTETEIAKLRTVSKGQISTHKCFDDEGGQCTDLKGLRWGDEDV